MRCSPRPTPAVKGVELPTGILTLVLPLTVDLVFPPAMAEPGPEQGLDPVLERIEALESERARDKALMLQYEARLREIEDEKSINKSYLRFLIQNFRQQSTNSFFVWFPHSICS